jgi:DNA-directed RNA polymerase specialized sigma24 family protein
MPGGTMAEKIGERTSMGGKGGRFQTTHWTAIKAMRSADSTQARVLLGELLQRYWKPVYCYLRRRGFDNDQAKDLTQSFFQEVVLDGRLLRSADPAKGRFRTLLLTALDRYLASEYRKRTAQKRLPRDGLIPLEWAQMAELPTAVQNLTCEDSFHYTWVTELLDALLAEVEEECVYRGMELHWTLFYERVVQPILEDRSPPPLADLCFRHGIDEATRASNMIFTVKKRFQRALRRHLRHSVTDKTEVDEEMQALAQFLDRRRQYDR